MTRPLLSVLLLALALPGCARVKEALGRPGDAAPAVETAEPEIASRPPPAGARTADALDTTTPEERAAASAAPEGGERLLGTTIASLGSPTEAGLWAKTPLVTSVQQGRLVYPANGKSAKVELRPLDAPEGAGSQVSLAALRLLGAPLTDLPELQVYGP